MPQKKILLGVLATLVMGVIAAMIYANLKVGGPPPDVNDPDFGNTDVCGQNVTFVVTEGERKKWEILSEKACYYPDKSGAQLTSITGEFFNDASKPVMTFTAPRGKYVNANNEVVLTGGVVAESISENKADNAEIALEAPTMRWSSVSEEVTAEGGVQLVHSIFGQSQAYQARFALDLTNLVMEGQVVSEMNVSEMNME